MSVQAIFFDAANTLVHKPALYPTLLRVLHARGINIPYEDIKRGHRLLSEIIAFPDRTSREFYTDFNSHLLRYFGILPDTELLDAIYEACSYLPWEAFSDVSHIANIHLPQGIISNWNTSLSDELARYVGVQFRWIYGSEYLQLRKPDPAFFTRALDASGLKAEDVLYVGDSLKLDVEPALQLGIRAILIDRDNLYFHSNVARIQSLESLESLL